MKSSAADPTSIPGLVSRQFGVEVAGEHARFREPGWRLQGSTSIECPNCDGLTAYISYRKPNTTTQGSYRYWGLVCLSCRTISALGDLDEELKKQARRWDAQVAASEIELDDEDLNTEADNDDGLDGAAVIEVAPEPITPDLSTVAAQATQATPVSAQVVDDSLRVVADAAKAELDASKSATHTVDVGPAKPASDDRLVFQIDQPAIDLGEQAHGELFLAITPLSPTRHQVSDVRVADRKMVVVTVVDAISDPADLRLYCEINPTVVAQAFADYLSKLTSAGQASVMIGGAALDARSSAFVEGLNPEQQEGVGAITSPGVCAIWGPPGTGKTRVIGEAVAELVRLGRSVSVVSNTNVAVDQALLHVARTTAGFTPGTVIRVGHPSIAEVADHPSLTVRKVIELTQADLIRELDDCREELTTLRSELEHTAHDTDSAKATMGDFTRDDVLQLLKRQAQRDRLPSATKELEKAHATQRTLQSARKSAASTRRQANEAWTTSAPFHDLEDVDQVVAAHDQEIAELETQNGRLQDQAAAAKAMSILKRRRAFKNLEHERSELERRLTESRDIRSGLHSRLEAAAREEMTPDRIRQLRAEREVASSDLDTATKALKAAADKAKRHRKTVDELEAVPPLGPTEDAVVELVGRSGSVDKVFEQLSAHDALVQELRTRIAAAETRVGQIQQRLSDLEKSIVRDAKVVGTTLAQLVLHRGLIERTFDHVIIDEASAALAPYAFAALSKAQLGGALVGDFEQNGPITRSSTEKLPASIKPWLTDHPSPT